MKGLLFYTDQIKYEVIDLCKPKSRHYTQYVNIISMISKINYLYG